MKSAMHVLNSFKRDRRGVTALEYGLIAAVIAVVIIAGASQLGSTIGNTFDNISASTETATK